ncbi:MAG: peptidylprolyl isomerase [Candidatus Lokiarchaeota archaeon]|nr:peptidylprolyl isomerase [Candidatus Lokiarchaeota archaeon]
MTVEKGDTIKVSYKGYFDDGEVFDSTDQHDGDLLEFTVGNREIISGFDKAVQGKDIGDEFKIRLEPEEAYGMYNDQAVQAIERSQLPADLVPEVGMVLQVEQQHGDHTHPVPVFITEVNPDTVTLDFNHPLAGKTLNFDIKIEKIVHQD